MFLKILETGIVVVVLSAVMSVLLAESEVSDVIKKIVGWLFIVSFLAHLVYAVCYIWGLV